MTLTAHTAMEAINVLKTETENKQHHWLEHVNKCVGSTKALYGGE